MLNVIKIALRNLARFGRRTLSTSTLITLGIVSVLLFVAVAGSFNAMRATSAPPMRSPRCPTAIAGSGSTIAISTRSACSCSLACSPRSQRRVQRRRFRSSPYPRAELRFNDGQVVFGRTVVTGFSLTRNESSRTAAPRVEQSIPGAAARITLWLIRSGGRRDLRQLILNVRKAVGGMTAVASRNSLFERPVKFLPVLGFDRGIQFIQTG